MKKWVASCFAALTMLLMASPAANAAGIVPGPNDSYTTSAVTVTPY